MDITVNAFAFVGLVLFAIIGGLCVGLAVGLIVWMLWEFRKDDREQKQVQQKIEQTRNQEYEGMKRNLLKFFDNGSGQGAKV